MSTTPNGEEVAVCTTPDCDRPREFTVFAEGYIASMWSGCAEHLSVVLLADLAKPGSTRRWTVREAAR